MTHYLLSVYLTADDATPSEEEMQQAYRDVDAFNTEVQEAGAWVFAGGLEPIDAATVVREHGGEVLVSDGPFAEAKEYIGGFWIIQADDLDAALGWARKATVACKGPVEVRPFEGDAG